MIDTWVGKFINNCRRRKHSGFITTIEVENKKKSGLKENSNKQMILKSLKLISTDYIYWRTRKVFTYVKVG